MSSRNPLSRVVLRRRGRRPRVALVALVCAIVGLAGLVPAAGALEADAAVATANGSATVSTSPTHRGNARSMGTTSPFRAPMPHRVQMGSRRPLPLLTRPTAGRSSSHRSPDVASSPMTALPQAGRAAGSGSKQIANFDGIDAVQQAAASGFSLEPPDEGLAAGAGRVANFVNVAGRIYRQDGTPLTPTFYLNTFFKESRDADTSDPRIYFDATSGRWIASILEYTFNPAGTAVTESHVDLAVSRSNDPTKAWNVYQIPASNPNHAGCPCLADYPILGVDRSNVYISTNEFTADLNSFNGAQLYAVSKSQLTHGAVAPNVVTFENLSAGGQLGYRVQPANSDGPSPAGYLLSSMDPNGTFDHRLVVWAVTNERSVSTGRGMPALTSRVINSQGYSVPPPAETPPGTCVGGPYCSKSGTPTTGLVETNDDAMQEAQYINGNLVGALGTGVTVAGDTGERSGAAWFVIRPHMSGASISPSTRVARQGYLAHQGEYLLFPHLNMTRDGSMAMVFGMGGPATYLSSAYATSRPGRGFGAIQVSAAGTGPDRGFTGTEALGGVGRWGDYSNGQIIPGTKRVWLATQYIPNAGTGPANWGNRIIGLRLP